MFYSAQHLIKQIGHSVVIQVHLDDLAEISVHQLHDQVDILKLFQVPLRRKSIK